MHRDWSSLQWHFCSTMCTLLASCSSGRLAQQQHCWNDGPLCARLTHTCCCRSRTNKSVGAGAPSNSQALGSAAPGKSISRPMTLMRGLDGVCWRVVCHGPAVNMNHFVGRFHQRQHGQKDGPLSMAPGNSFGTVLA